MKKLAMIFLIIGLVLAGCGVGGYYVYKSVKEDSEITDTPQKEHEDIVEDVEFKVYNVNGEELPRISETQFDAGKSYTFKVSKEYKLDIIPNDTVEQAKDISYRIDDTYYNLLDNSSFLKGFNITQSEDNSFTIDLTKDANLENILEKLYGSDIEINTSDVIKPDKIFTIVIRAVGSNDVRYIDFGLNTVDVNVYPSDLIIG